MRRLRMRLVKQSSSCNVSKRRKGAEILATIAGVLSTTANQADKVRAPIAMLAESIDHTSESERESTSHVVAVGGAASRCCAG